MKSTSVRDQDSTVRTPGKASLRAVGLTLAPIGLSLALVLLSPPSEAQAQCGSPGTPPCEPQPSHTPRRPTRIPATATSTPTLTPTATLTSTPTATGIPCDTHVLTAQLIGANEVPSVLTEGQGTVKLLLDLNTGTITGNWSISSLSGLITAAHIHNGPAGKNAGVFIPFTGLPAGGGSFATLNNAPVAKMQDVLSNPSGYYLNVHSGAHPGGEIRGQLACAPAQPVASPTPTATATPVGGPTGGGGSVPAGLALGLAGLGVVSMGLGLFSLRRSYFTGGVRIGLILVGALSLLGALLLWLLTMAGALPGSERPAASPTFDFSTLQMLVPFFGLGGSKRSRPSTLPPLPQEGTRADDTCDSDRLRGRRRGGDHEILN